MTGRLVVWNVHDCDSVTVESDSRPRELLLGLAGTPPDCGGGVQNCGDLRTFGVVADSARLEVFPSADGALRPIHALLNDSGDQNVWLCHFGGLRYGHCAPALLVVVVSTLLWS